jgi:hypothetical protein
MRILLFTKLIVRACLSFLTVLIFFVFSRRTGGMSINISSALSLHTILMVGHKVLASILGIRELKEHIFFKLPYKASGAYRTSC